MPQIVRQRTFVSKAKLLLIAWLRLSRNKSSASNSRAPLPFHYSPTSSSPPHLNLRYSCTFDVQNMLITRAECRVAWKQALYIIFALHWPASSDVLRDDLSVIQILSTKIFFEYRMFMAFLDTHRKVDILQRKHFLMVLSNKFTSKTQIMTNPRSS